MTASDDAPGDLAQCHVFPIRDARRTLSLGDALHAMAAEITSARRQRRLPEVGIVVDVEGVRMPVAGPGAIRDCVAPLVASACEAAGGPARASDGPRIREVVITAVDTPRGLEIEVADSGPGPESLAADALATVRSRAEQLGGGLMVAVCPEGGAAVTLRLPSREAPTVSMRPAA